MARLGVPPAYQSRLTAESSKRVSTAPQARLLPSRCSGGRGSLKRSSMAIWPLKAPNFRRPGGGTGDSRTTGTFPRRITTSSPDTASAIRRERWILASCNEYWEMKLSWPEDGTYPRDLQGRSPSGVPHRRPAAFRSGGPPLRSRKVKSGMETGAAAGPGPGGLGGRSGAGTRSDRRHCQADGRMCPGRVRIKALSGSSAHAPGAVSPQARASASRPARRGGRRPGPWPSGPGPGRPGGSRRRPRRRPFGWVSGRTLARQTG